MKPLKAHVDDAVQFQAREHFTLDRFRGEHHPAPRAAKLVADRVGGVDLFFRIALAVSGFDVDHQVARDRHHRGLALFGVEADEQDRVAVRRVAAVGRVLGAHPPVRAEDQERLWAAVVFGRHHALGSVDLVQLREDLFGDARDLVQGQSGGRAAAQQHDQHAPEDKAFQHAPPRRGRTLVVIGSHGIAAHIGNEGEWEGSGRQCSDNACAGPSLAAVPEAPRRRARYARRRAEPSKP